MKAILIIRVLDEAKPASFRVAREIDVSFTPHAGMTIIHGLDHEEGHIVEQAAWDEVGQQFLLVLEDDNITGMLDCSAWEYIEATYLKQDWWICKGHHAERA